MTVDSETCVLYDGAPTSELCRDGLCFVAGVCSPGGGVPVISFDSGVSVVCPCAL